MRIVIATGIYPPEIGGPALYAQGVKESLERDGHRAPLVLFGSLRPMPTGIRHVLYAVKLFFAARGADAIFAFDTYSVGIPAVFVGLLLRISVVVRVGGDFVWESYVERTGDLIPLPHFYQRIPSLGIKGRIAFFFVRWMLRHAELAFNTRWLLDIWQPVYGFSSERAHVVGNVIGERISGSDSDRTMLLYGRSLSLKNAPAFRRAFARARKRGLDLTLEERAVSHEQLIERIKGAHAVVLPSISDVAPNTVIDALRCGKPFLLTKYSGYAEEFKDYGVIVDPLDEEDMARGMEALADKKTYNALCAHIAAFTRVRTYDDVARECIELVIPDTSEGIRVLQLGSDRSTRGSITPGTSAFERQESYARMIGKVEDISFSLRSDPFQPTRSAYRLVIPTKSLSSLLYGFDAIRIARHLRPHLVSAQDPFEAGLAGLVIARMKGVPLYVQVHTDFLSPEYARHSLLNRLRVFIAGFVLRRASRVRVVSERIRKSLEKKYHFRAPISILPIFADLERIHATEPHAALAARFAGYEKKLLVVSRLEPEKNVAGALEAFARSAPQNACLIIVGEGNERASLEHRAHQLGISERVFFEGSRDAAPYYYVADLLLVPSFYEGYGLVIVEALAAGKPVLSTDVGAAREAGAIITSVEQFADALSTWFEEGPREAELKAYPYTNFETYVQAYRDDIAACIPRASK